MFGIDLLNEFSFELDPFGCVDQTFKDGKLDALTVILADAGDTAEATPASGGLGVDVVSYND